MPDHWSYPTGRRRPPALGSPCRLLPVLLLLPLLACAPQLSQQTIVALPQYAPNEAVPARPRIGVLLPLTGRNSELGQAMLNAAQLALFEQGDPTFELAPLDTRGTPTGAAEAARLSLAGGARLLVGPLTAAETGAVAQAARVAGVPVLAFTSDGSQGSDGVWTLGITPTEQVRRVAFAAAARGARRFAVIAPDGEFGRRVVAALTEALVEQGLPPPLRATSPRGDATPALRQVVEQAAAVEGGGVPDAILFAESGERTRRLAGGLQEAGLNPPLRILGTALWGQDQSLGQEPALVGAWFPGPDPNAQLQFEQRYQAAFGTRPPALAGIAYDATGLAVRAMRGGTPQPLGTGQIFLGAAGPLRLQPTGQVARGLAVFEVQAAGPAVVVEPAVIPGLPGS